MNNVQPNFQMVECDDQTAELHMAVAEMMQDDEGEMNAQQVQVIQPDVMQFTVAQDQAYAKQDKMYSFQKMILLTIQRVSITMPLAKKLTMWLQMS